MVVEDFIACGRCSFFLAGYRVLHGLDALREAAEASDEWLTLRWDSETKRLVMKSYGSRLDIEFYYFDGRCPECQRRFVIAAEGQEQNAAADEASGADAGAALQDDAAESAPVDAEVEEGVVENWEAPEPTMLRVALTSD